MLPALNFVPPFVGGEGEVLKIFTNIKRRGENHSAGALQLIIISPLCHADIYTRRVHRSGTRTK